MKSQTPRQYLGESLDACNRAVDVFKEGEAIVIKYQETQYESQQLISYLQAQTFEDLLWTPYAAFKGEIDEIT